VSWGEDIDLAACGRLMREMIRARLFAEPPAPPIQVEEHLNGHD